MPRAVLACAVFLVFLVPVPVPAQKGAKSDRLTLGELRSLLEKARVKHDLPALAAGIVHGNGEGRVGLVGIRKRGTDVQAMADDEWHLGSNTKPMTALLFALLMDLGLIDWDTPLERIFPEHAGKWSTDLKKITPAHLLTHTSGLPRDWPGDWFKIGGKGSPRDQRTVMVKSLESITLKTKPGEKHEYSNLGYVLLGAIIDRRGKASWEEQIEKRIFRPLGITHWGLGPVIAKNAVTQPWPHDDNGKPASPEDVLDNPPIMNSAGRVRMSVADHDRFLAETLRLARGEKGLLKPATARKIFTNPFPASPYSLSGWYGLPKQRGAMGLVLAHDGSNGLNYCWAGVMPDQDLAICVLTNQGGPDGAGAKTCLEVFLQLAAPK
jgi:D-alanyl-D-alanine carboxypeptidase